MAHPLPSWGDMTSAQAEALAEQDPVLVLPVSAIEQHGPHLPLSTDWLIGEGILSRAFRQLPADFPARVLPTQCVGASAEHLDFAGTLSLDADLLTTVVCEIGTCAAATGVRRLVLANSHGGNVSALETAGLRLRYEEGMLVVKWHYFHSQPPDDVRLPATEFSHGLHGGAVETSMMLHLRPDLVRTEQLTDASSLGEALESEGSRISPDGAASFAWIAQDLHPSGAVGNATVADAEKGRRLLDYYGSLLAGIIQDAKSFHLDRLA